MRHLLIAIFILVSLPVWGWASWTAIPLETLVKDSDLIVVGTLENITKHAKTSIEYQQGTIKVAEVLWGQPPQDHPLTLLWSYNLAQPTPRLDFSEREGKLGIWLLTYNGADVKADYPGRFVELKEKAKVLDSLIKESVCLRLANGTPDAGNPIMLTLIYRNATDQPQAFPGIKYQNDRLYFNSLLTITLKTEGESSKVVEPLANRLIEEALLGISVPPKQEQHIEIDLSKLFPLNIDESYTVQVTKKTAGFTNQLTTSNLVGFTVQPNETTTNPTNSTFPSPSPTPSSLTSQIDSDDIHASDNKGYSYYIIRVFIIIVLLGVVAFYKTRR